MARASHRSSWVRVLSIVVVAAAASAAACGSSDELYWAISRGDLARVEAEAKKRGPNFTTRKDRTALIQASSAGNVEVVTKLLDLGADPNFPDAKGWTALTHACYERELDVVRLLLARGGDPRRVSTTEETPQIAVHILRAKGPREAEVVGVLADAGALGDLGAPMPPGWRDGGRPLFRVLIDDGKLDVIEAYLARGASLETRIDGKPMLVAAIEARSLPAVRLLLKREVDPRGNETEIRAALEGLKKESGNDGRVAVLEAAFDAGLATADERVQAFDAAEAAQKRAAEERRAAKRKEEAALRAREEAAERRAAEARKSTPSPASTSPPKLVLPDALAQAGRKTADPPPTKRPLPDVCYEPAVAACRARGGSCHECWIKSLGGGESEKTETRCLNPSAPVPCGRQCCGYGYKCCPGDSTCTEVNIPCRRWR